MENRKRYYAFCAILTLIILAGSVWFLAVWIPTINPAEKVVEIVFSGVMLLTMLTLAIVLLYAIKAHSTRFAVAKGINLTVGLLLFIGGLTLVAFGVSQIIAFYTNEATRIGVLLFGLGESISGLSCVLLGSIVSRRNLKIEHTEKVLEYYSKVQPKPETFNDKKHTKTCEFCGCRLKTDDVNCPNCQAKIETKQNEDK